ncbi:MAG: hypothetical protein EXR61_00930 [Chloroflexi bacterium]|nr:hypothetical protein [Chloroflexota bacterium]
MVIIPSVDVRGGKVAFRTPTVGADVTPEDLARRFVAMGARELHLVDLDGAETGEHLNAALLGRIARTSGVTCRLAGGIDSLAKAGEALEAGFAGVLFSSAVFGDDTLVERIATTLGDAATVELETAEGCLQPRGGDPTLAARARGRTIDDAARAAVDAGVRSLYVIDVTSDGRLSGPALGLLERVRSSLGPRANGVAFHTGGGIRDLTDLGLLARWGAASAVVGRALADRRFTYEDAVAAGEEVP